MRVKPYGNYVLIKLDPRQDAWKGIALPGETDAERRGHCSGVVAAVGAGRVETRTVGKYLGVCNPKPAEQLAPGDRVAFRSFLKDLQPVECMSGGEAQYFLVHFFDLLGTIEKDVQVGPWSSYAI